MTKKLSQVIGLTILVAGLWTCGNKTTPLAEKPLWAGIKPAVKEKIDSFFKDPRYSNFKIYDVFITRTNRNAYLMISAVMDKNHFEDRVYPDTYFFYNERLLFVYTGMAALFTAHNYPVDAFNKMIDSAFVRNHITLTSPMMANPPRMMLKITPDDSVSTDLDPEEWNLLNDDRSKIQLGDFGPVKMKAGHE